MYYAYPYQKDNLKNFLEHFHLKTSKINWIINDHKYLIENNTLLLSDTIFNENEVSPIYQELDVLYEDDYLLVVDKPTNMIIYSDNPMEVTLDRIVAGYLKKNGLNAVPRHIYRLDKETIGVMVYAKDPLTLSYLSHLVENRNLLKEYRAVISNKLPSNKGIINKKIGTDRHINGKMVISNSGKDAITNYQLIEESENRSLVSLILETGRTHQIRVHLSSIGCPIVGDSLYGSNVNSPLMLQSYLVSFVHPITNKTIEIITNKAFQI